MKIDKVLWTTDLTKAARASFTTAAHWAHAFGAELHLLHVATPATRRSSANQELPDEAELAKALEEETGPLLKALEDTAPDQEPPVLHHGIRMGATATPKILEYIKDTRIDLVVLSTHGRTGLGRLFLGSTADALLRSGLCKVLTVRRKIERPVGENKILVPIDFSKASQGALEAAAAISAWTGARVEVLHVVEAAGDWDGNFGSIRTWPTVEEVQENALELAKQLIEPIAIDPDLVEFHIETGFIGESILRFAEASQPSLLLQASHSGGLERRLIGSTAERILHRSEVPVLTLPSTENQAAV